MTENINVPCVPTLYTGCRRVSANDTTPPVRLGLSVENCLCFRAGSTHVSKAVPPQRAEKKQGRDRNARFPSVTAVSPSQSRNETKNYGNYLIPRSRKATTERRQLLYRNAAIISTKERSVSIRFISKPLRKPNRRNSERCCYT